MFDVSFHDRIRHRSLPGHSLPNTGLPGERKRWIDNQQQRSLRRTRVSIKTFDRSITLHHPSVRNPLNRSDTKRHTNERTRDRIWWDPRPIPDLTRHLLEGDISRSFGRLY